jgi:hypothetical protein
MTTTKDNDFVSGDDLPQRNTARLNTPNNSQSGWGSGNTWMPF